jgi:holo-[acyl-carrier protein] synthase
MASSPENSPSPAPEDKSTAMTRTVPGIDLVETERIARAIARQGEAFLARVFTPAERAYCDSLRHPHPSFAARWAAKEAVAKAFGSGIGADASMHEIEVIRSPQGQPSIALHGSAAGTAQRLGVTAISISLTHTEHYAAAFAILTIVAPPAESATLLHKTTNLTPPP